MSRRRSRYTVTMPNGDRKVCLAYSAEGAQRCFRGAVQVRKGDFRIEARKATQRPTGARPNQRAIREAVAFLGITLPVEVKVTSAKGGRNAAHRTLLANVPQTRPNRYSIADLDSVSSQDAGFSHKITVKNWLPADQMGASLWHELAHAMQFERDAYQPDITAHDVIRRWNRAYFDGTNYARKPYEVEANGYMEHNDEMPLAGK